MTYIEELTITDNFETTGKKRTIAIVNWTFEQVYFSNFLEYNKKGYEIIQSFVNDYYAMLSVKKGKKTIIRIYRNPIKKLLKGEKNGIERDNGKDARANKIILQDGNGT